MDFCLFCKNGYKSKISKHYESVHTLENEVQNILRLPLKSRDRKVAWMKLQNEGNYKDNVKVRQLLVQNFALLKRHLAVIHGILVHYNIS